MAAYRLFTMPFALFAHLSAVTVSSMFEAAGEQFTNMSVFAVPPRESCMSCVSLWFRYGTTAFAPAFLQRPASLAAQVLRLTSSSSHILV
eukprot:CAMPEP_0178991624 /NCGR_PEP_ID=MMETSP0795-20121207/5637_1 /TAXON_ID=88552 /ORGANISM="Amoebophrya sp., Strain Ameob2" /LENGTH=89 /DNA_ID=CAMNT_0020683365 /DNA_START=269 /DNA_END=538 /DNA_ORIENTATION=+